MLVASFAGAALVWWVRPAAVEPAPSRFPSRFPVHGIDVSRHNGAIDWPRVADAGVAFAWIKASEGGDVRDPRFTENVTGASAAGLRVGAYHFFTFCRPAADQARQFLAHSAGAAHAAAGRRRRVRRQLPCAPITRCDPRRARAVDRHGRGGAGATGGRVHDERRRRAAAPWAGARTVDEVDPRRALSAVVLLAARPVRTGAWRRGCRRPRRLSRLAGGVGLTLSWPPAYFIAAHADVGDGLRAAAPRSGFHGSSFAVVPSVVPRRSGDATPALVLRRRSSGRRSARLGRTSRHARRRASTPVTQLRSARKVRVEATTARYFASSSAVRSADHSRRVAMRAATFSAMPRP